MEDRKSGFCPEIVVVTGDIAKTGTKSEYNLANQFFDRLLNSLELPSNCLFVVPGNHDVNRRLYRKSDIPKYATMKDLNEELENEEFRQDLFKGMEDYFSFVEVGYPHLISNNKRLVPFVSTYKAQCGSKIGLVGLNSAWMCRRSADKGTIAIGEFQVKKATEELKNNGNHDLVIYVFHHPMSWLWHLDRNICRSYFQDSIVLSGHLHDSYGGYLHDLDGRIFQFQAGASYIGSESLNKFSYTVFNWTDNSITLSFRKFSTQHRKWFVDAELAEDGIAVFPLISSTGISTTNVDIEEILREDRQFLSYMVAALNEHRHLPTKGFETTLRIPIELERVSIPWAFHAALSDKSQITNDSRIVHKPIATIKEVFELARHSNFKDIILLGDPGSGKTTLFKYILITLIKGHGKERLGLKNDLIPFYAPLKELKDPDAERFFDFIKRACFLKEFSISEYSLNNLFDEGRAIILLDGLDEITNFEKRIATCKWIDRARKALPKVAFIISSRFSGYIDKIRLDKTIELSIQDFSDDAVKNFLIRWFEAVEIALHPDSDEDSYKEMGHQSAINLFEGITSSDQLRNLSRNPLILQMIALVHRNRGTLPQRRVELYKECVNVFLEKWDMAKGLNILLTAREARVVLQALALWFHQREGRRSAPVKEFMELIRSSLDQIGKSNIDPKEFIHNIRDRSGIFTGYSADEFGFIHLSFQEYLAAEHIRNTGAIDVLVTNYDKRWWGEVIRLCLALGNPSIMNRFMEKIIPTENFSNDISLAIDSIRDSIDKPVKPLTDALNNKQLSSAIKNNCMKILKDIGGPIVLQALKSFKDIEDPKIATLARKTISEEIYEEKKPSSNAERIRSKAQIFLCYAREDEQTVSDLYERLLSEGFRPWMDKKNILPGQRWDYVLQNAIIHSDFFLACLSPNSARKRGVLQKEIKQALDIWETKLNSDIYLIPVRLQECSVPDYLSNFQWVDLYGDDGFRWLVKGIYAGIERKSK